MQGKLFKNQKCTHVLYCSVLSLGDNVNQQIYRPGTPNSDIRKLCTVHCWRNVNKSSAPTAVEEKGLNTDKQSDVTVKNKRN